MKNFKHLFLITVYSIGLTNCFGQRPGDAYLGGIVFYIFQKGDIGYVAGEVHGLIAATKDQTTIEEWEKIKDGAVWGCYENELLKVDRTAIGTGIQNTLDILAGCNQDGIAAKLASDYQVIENGVTYDDWFLPSKDELNKLYLNKDLVGEFAFNRYWSSTQHVYYLAWVQYFTDGFQILSSSKTSNSAVRSVRAF
ncbi:MAG: DUF1566 domain-containing protein [Flammeovirgaceae bacterium]|nr:DUF1566 domain-containing protein [Flammeovirgaceae bacterium]